MAARAIYTGLIFRVIVRAIHLGRSMPFGVYVSHVACLDESDSATSRQGIANVYICGSVSTVRFARSGRISFRLMAQRLEVSVDNMARESWMYYRHSNSK